MAEKLTRKLTKKQSGFVKTYVQTGIATIAAKKNYNITTEGSARAVGSHVLTNTNVQAAIAAYGDGLPDELLREKHIALLNKKEIKRTFDHQTGEWIDIETGQVETAAVSKGLELAYKVKGMFAPEQTRSINLNVDAKATPDKLEELREEYEEKLRARLLENEPQ
jgi:phage terminase small subunit